jgi:hypothetical protein
MDVFKTLLLDTPDSLNAITGTLQISNGGTGATSAAGARDNLLPDYTGNVGKVLTVNAGATDVEWTTNGAGTVTSVDVSGGTTGLTTSGGPVTSSGTITLAGTLAVANGGTGASTLTGYVKGTGTAALTASATIPNTDITGLGTMSTQDAATVNIDGGAIDGTTVGATTPSTVAATTGAFSGSVKVSGPITNAAANSVLFAHNGTDAQVWALGPNPSTQGQLVIVPARSDASFAAVAATFNASGGNGAWGATTPSTVAATTLTTSGTATFSGNVAVGSNAVTISTGGNVTAIDTVQVNSGTIRTALTYDTGVAVIGSYTNHPVSLRVNQTQVGQLTTTGLNSTAIGATTPSTGAFTTVTATGAADTIIGSESGTGSGTGGGVIAATASANGNASFGWRTNGVNRWVMDTVGTSDSESVRIRKLGTGAASVATFSSTGLAVTGALSATGYIVGAGTNPGGLGGSKWIYDWFGGNHRQFSMGADASTNGAWVWYSQRSDGSNSVIPMTLTSTGLAVEGALSATGVIGNPSTTGFALFRAGASGSQMILFPESNATLPNQAFLDGDTITFRNVAGTTRSVISSTGLAVTGALSSTGALAIGNTVNTVSPTSPDRTITMVIGGTTYYIHAKTTND